MSDADRAYAAAERLIEEAARTGAEELSFDRAETHALERLPPEIAALTHLKVLDLERTRVSDLAALSELAALTELRLGNTAVVDLGPLSDSTSLTRLWLTQAPVSDLSPLAKLTSLVGLWLRGTPVRDIAPLSGLTALVGLELSDTLIGLETGDTEAADLSHLSGLTRLTDLRLSRTGVASIAPLSALRALTVLRLEGTEVRDLTPLEGLVALTDLRLNDTAVSDLMPLSGLAGLMELRLDGSRVFDLRPLRPLWRLISEYGHDGLSFKNTAATTAVPRIAEIAEIDDPAERARTLFAYLEDWAPPSESTPRPDVSVDTLPNLFISYSRNDRPQIAAFRELFRAQGLPVWWDQDIPAGAAWREEIARRLVDSNAVVTFWTGASVTSNSVIEEASRAQAAGKLVHVRLDDAALPFGFAETQYVDLRDWDRTAFHPQMQKLLMALRDKVSPPTADQMAARLAASSPVAMLPRGGVLAPVDTPPHVRPEVENASDLAARIEGLKQIVTALLVKAADRQNYQFPTDLQHALSGAKMTLTAATPS